MKQQLNVQDVARILTETASEVSPEEFAQIADDVLEDNSPGEIAAIGKFMPPALRDLLPKRVLH